MSTELSTRPTSLAPIALPDMFKLGEMLVTTGFLPKAIDTPAKAVAVMLKGQELGIPPMYALNNIAIVNGKQVCQAELMLAMIYRDHGSKAVQFLETNDRVCRIRYQRPGAEPGELAFTVEEADAAGLLTKPGPPGGVAPWKGYRPAMLRARAISAMARIAFPDTIAGMYTPEELGARVVVTSDGEIVMDDEPEATQRPTDPQYQPSPARSFDGETMKPALTPERHRELLMDRYAELWDRANQLDIDVPEVPPLADWTREQLAAGCKELRELIKNADLTDEEAMS